MITIALAALGAGLFAWLLGSALVRPVQHPVALPPDFPATVVTIPGNDHAISGWWLDLGPESPVVLLLHGVRGDRSAMLSRARMLVRRGFSVLLIDLQGHGETPGEAITMGWLEAKDVQAAHAWIRRNAPARRTGVVACSLGGAAVLLAPQPGGFDAVVLEAVYPRFTQAVENRVRIRLGPLARAFAPLLLVQLRPRLHIAALDLEPIRFIERIGAPVLVVAGSLDEHTTLVESEELFHAAAEPKRLWVVAGARHEDFLSFDPAAYEAEVIGFLSAHLRPSS